MAKRYFTVPAKVPTFPMLSEEQPRTVMQNSEGGSSGLAPPSLYYCHNVMPSSEGLDSVGFLSVIPAYSPVTTLFQDVRVIYSTARNRLYLAFDSAGGIYALNTATVFWVKLVQTSPVTSEDITIGTVNGISYIFYKGVGAYTYNDATSNLEPVTLTGLSLPNILGVVGSYGYLIAYTENTVAWSSTIAPTDFVPSLTTGAGGGDVAGIGGAIRFVLPNSLGILIYSETNVISGSYTGNVKYPFKFREVDNSKGGKTLDFVAYEANATAQFVYSKAGLQAVTSQKAEPLLPEVTNFLAGKKLEDFDELTQTLYTIELTAAMRKKVKFIASRYLVISYGATSFTHALIYDVALKRLGKIKLAHADVFEYVGEQVEVSRESIAFLLDTGEVKAVDFSTHTAATGVAIFGKLQYTRSRLITLHEVHIENVALTSSLKVTDLASVDGRTQTQVVGTELTKVEGFRKYGFRTTGVNHSILLVGKFDLTTLFIAYSLNGRR